MELYDVDGNITDLCPVGGRDCRPVPGNTHAWMCKGNLKYSLRPALWIRIWFQTARQLKLALENTLCLTTYNDF